MTTRVMFAARTHSRIAAGYLIPCEGKDEADDVAGVIRGHVRRMQIKASVRVMSRTLRAGGVWCVMHVVVVRADGVGDVDRIRRAVCR